MNIYYFSGTGNSLHIARMLKIDNDQLIPILSVLGEKIDTGEEVLLVYPVYMNALPKPVKQFVLENDFASAKYIAAVATHCGVPGKSGMYLNDQLKRKNLVLDDYFEVQMINNTPKGVAPKPLMKLNWENLITKQAFDDLEKKNEDWIKTIKERINGRVGLLQADLSKGNVKAAGFIDKILWKIGESSDAKLNFLLDESCSACGICAKVCPTGRIQMLDGLPKWKSDHDCYYCYACFNFCPEQAIGVKHYTKKMGRYHYPTVDFEDIVNQRKR